MPYLFRPPLQWDSARTYQATDSMYPVTALATRLFRYIKRGPVGQSVLKLSDGTYVVTEYPTTDQVLEAVKYYEGGHEYYVSQEEAADLTQAGFTVDVTP